MANAANLPRIPSFGIELYHVVEEPVTGLQGVGLRSVQFGG